MNTSPGRELFTMRLNSRMPRPSSTNGLSRRESNAFALVREIAEDEPDELPEPLDDPAGPRDPPLNEFPAMPRPAAPAITAVTPNNAAALKCAAASAGLKNS